jgi:hypothetical protein
MYYSFFLEVSFFGKLFYSLGSVYVVVVTVLLIQVIDHHAWFSSFLCRLHP